MELTPDALAAALGLPPPTDEQAEVIAAPARPALVVAGAGAGKTETMAARVVWLVATGQVLPEQVLGLTFTRKAAQQLGARVRSRLRRLAGSRLLDELDPSGQRRADVLAGEPTISTYHAYAGRLVGEHALLLPAEPAARLLGQTATWQLAHRVVTSWADELEVDVIPSTVTGWLLGLAGEMGEHLVEPAAVRALAERVIHDLSTAPRGKGQRAEPSQTYRRWIETQRRRGELLPLVEAFSARKRAERAVDFTDQLAIAARVAAQHPEVGATERAAFRAVLLDEYQDTGYAQRVLLRALYGTMPGAPVRPDDPAVTAVGDPCQSIYGWRGASAGNLLRFRTDFPSVDGPAEEYGLLTSFRNPPEVLELANVVSAPLRASPSESSARRGRAARRPGRAAGRCARRTAARCRRRARLDGRRDRRAVGGPGTDRQRRPDVGRAGAAPGRHGSDRHRAAGPRAAGRGGGARRPAGHPGGAGSGVRAAPGGRSARRAGRGTAAHRGPLAARRGRPGGALATRAGDRAGGGAPVGPAHPGRAGPRRAARRARRAGRAGRRPRRPRPGGALLGRGVRPDQAARPRAGLAAGPRFGAADRPGGRRRADPAARRRDRRSARTGRAGPPRRVRRRGDRVRDRGRGGHAARPARLPGDRGAGRGRADPRRGGGRP